MRENMDLLLARFDQICKDIIKKYLITVITSLENKLKEARSELKATYNT